VIIQLSRTAAIISSASVTITYTMIGQMIAVAYTDIVQLVLITGGLVSHMTGHMIDDSSSLHRYSTACTDYRGD